MRLSHRIEVQFLGFSEGNLREGARAIALFPHKFRI